MQVTEDSKARFNLAQALLRAEAQHIHAVLNIVRWRKGVAAELLGISRKNLWEKVRKLERLGVFPKQEAA